MSANNFYGSLLLYAIPPYSNKRVFGISMAWDFAHSRLRMVANRMSNPVLLSVTTAMLFFATSVDAFAEGFPANVMIKYLNFNSKSIKY
jgi:hypothetical protein